MKFKPIAITLAILMTSISLAQEKPRQRTGRNYPPKMPGAKVEVYKTIGDVKLNTYIFFPKDHKPSDKRAAIVFIFGGGWKSGSPRQFHQHCKYLASRGMVAMTADYRVRSRHETLARSCVADAKSAVRWVRKNAKRLGVAPDRIAAGGCSAGGHLAACTGVIKGFEESGEDTSISSIPNAMVLFNPALVLAPVDGKPPLDETRMKTLPDRMGVEPIKLSPYHQVNKGVCRTIIFHGKADSTVPFKTAQQFTGAMAKARNQCTLLGYEDEEHGFFNFGRNGNRRFKETVNAMDLFLVDLGYLKGQPTIDDEGE